jgi:hypothetical protein
MIALASVITSPLFAYALFAVRETVAPLERGNKKSVALSSLTLAGSTCTFSGQLSSSFTNPDGGDSLLHKVDYDN